MNTSSDSRTTWCLLISAAASDGVQLVMADPTTAATSRLAAATSGAPTVVARGPASSSRWARSEQANPANSGPRRSGKNNTNAVVSVLRCGCKKKRALCCLHKCRSLSYIVESATGSLVCVPDEQIMWGWKRDNPKCGDSLYLMLVSWALFSFFGGQPEHLILMLVMTKNAWLCWL